MRQLADQTVGPALSRKARLLARHELKRAVRPRVDDRVGAEDFFQVGVERGEAVVRRAASRHQKPHGVALVAEGRLHGDEDVAEPHALNQQLATERAHATWRRPPLRLDVCGVRAEPQVLFDAHPVGDVCDCAEAFGVPAEQHLTQTFGVRRDFDRVAFGAEAAQNLVDAREHVEVCRRADVPFVGREAEEDEREFDLAALRVL